MMIYAPITGEPTATFILVAVKALLRSEAPHQAILAMIAELEKIGEMEREQAEQRRAVLDAAASFITNGADQ